MGLKILNVVFVLVLILMVLVKKVRAGVLDTGWSFLNKLYIFMMVVLGDGLSVFSLL